MPRQRVTTTRSVCTDRRLLVVFAVLALAWVGSGCAEEGDPELTGNASAAAPPAPAAQALEQRAHSYDKGYGGDAGDLELALEVRSLATSFGVTPIPPAPAVRDELFELGQALMFDKELSGNRNIACMTCHHTTLLSDDDRHLAAGEGGVGLGHDRLGGDIHVRNALGLFNLHAIDRFFFDMRLEDLPGGHLRTPALPGDITPDIEAAFEFGPLSALGMFPVVARDEMRGQRFHNVPNTDNELAGNLSNPEVWDGLMARLGAIPGYVDMFEAAYPGVAFQDMNFGHASNAMAGFMIRGFEARGSRWQQFLEGDNAALGQSELLGAKSFFEDGCADCHNGPMFTDQMAHNTGLAQFGVGRKVGPYKNEDHGRAGITYDPDDKYKFRTQPLINVTLTGPWGHVGQFSDLRDFVDHYDDPVAKLHTYDMAAQIHPSEDYLLDMRADDPYDIQLNIDPLADVSLANPDHVVAFLGTLTDPASADQSHLLPATVPSGLPVDELPAPEVGGKTHGAVEFIDLAPGDAALAAYRRAPSTRAAIADAIKQQSLTQPMNFFDLAGTPMRWRGMPGVAVFDYDNDGDQDLFVTNGPGAPNSLFQSQLADSGEMRFVDVAATAGVEATATDNTGVCYGDIDNDGDHDVYVVAHEGPSHLFRNEGDGTFTDISATSGATPASTGGTSCGFGDIDNDGLLDLFVARGWHQNNAVACFFDPYGSGIQHNELHRNLGGGQFTDVSATSGIYNIGGVPAGAPTITWSAALVDYDLDGDVDIFTADDQCGFPNSKFPQFGGIDRGFLQIFDNDGTGNFTNRTFEAGTNHASAWMGLSFGDFNADGHLDFFAPSFGDWGKLFAGAPITLGDETSRWYLGGPNKTFTPGQSDIERTPFGWGTVARDFDNDGDTDLSFHGGLDLWFFVDKSNPGSMLLNDGDANFGLDLDAFQARHSRRNDASTAAGDLNGDGFPDIITVSNFDVPEPMPLVQYGGADDEVQFFSVYDPYSYLTPTFEFIGRDATQLPTDEDAIDKDPNHNPPSKIEQRFRWNEEFVYPDGTITVEINNADSNNRWASIRLVGTAGLTPTGVVNRDAIGALIEFTPFRGDTVMAPVLGGSSHLSQDSLTQNFGLGSVYSGQADILWPGGVRNRLYGVHHGEQLTVPELPCSYDTDDDIGIYGACVQHALQDLSQAGLVSPQLRLRMHISAVLAYLEAH